MDPISTFSGIVSGIDFQTLTDQIIAFESRPIQRVDRRIQEITRRSSALGTFRGLVETFETASESLRDGLVFDARVASTSGGGGVEAFTVDAGPGAAVGSNDVRVLGVATAERLSGSDFASRDEALGISGSFLVDGRSVTLDTSDALEDVARKINEASLSGSEATAQASLLQLAPDRFRLVLAAQETGSDGIDLVDPDGLLRDLGFVDETVAIKTATTSGAMSDGFGSTSLTLADQLGLDAPPSGTVDLGGVAVALDLATMSLDDVAAAIRTAATGAGSAIDASVVAESVDGVSSWRLDITGTTSFTDDGRVLEALGVLTAGRSAVAQEIRSGAALQQADGSTPAAAGTLLTDLAIGGGGAGVASGDTLTLSGTRGDGTTFTTTYTIGAGDTVQDLLDRLNDPTDGFGAGASTATASLGVDGRIAVAEDAGGDSQLALSIVAHNENGGSLDFGEFDVTTSGRDRVVTEGEDATLEIDGVFIRRSDNRISDVLEGVTLELKSAAPGQTTRVEVDRDAEAVVDAVKNLVDAYNEVAAFARGQGADENGEGGGPLRGDATLRTMVSTLRRSMQERLGSDVAGGLTRLGDLGIEIRTDGSFSLDVGTLRDIVAARPLAVERLIGNWGTGSNSAIEFVSSSTATAAGTYDIEITQAATRAEATGVGFAGAYVDDGTADTLSVRDIASDATYSVELSDGMTMADIVAALDAELSTSTTHRITAQNALASDALATPATASTALADLHVGGASAGVAGGDTFTFAGRRSDGTSFLASYVVADAASETLGDVLSALGDELGDDFSVFVDEAGVITAESDSAGSNVAEFTLTSDNAGGGGFDLGVIEATRPGRAAAPIEVSEVGGQLSLSHLDHGSGAGFEVSFAAGGADGSASLGLGAGSWTGLDVAGTIGGHAATGRGRLLTADDGSPVEGLVTRYTGAGVGAVGTMTFSRGLASLIELSAEPLLGGDQGSIQSIIDAGDARIGGLETRISFLEERLERRRAQLIDRFVAMEQALAQGQQQVSFLLSQLGQSSAPTNR